MANNLQKRAFAYLFLTFFLFGSIYIASKLIADDISPAYVAAIRCILAIIPLGILSRKYWDVSIDKTDKKYFLIIGILGYFINIHLLQIGIKLTGVSVAALINSLTPVAVTLFAVILLHEKVTKTKTACLFLAIVGTAIITWSARGKGEFYGIVSVFLAMSMFALASVFMRKVTIKYPPILVTFYSMLVSAGLNIPVVIYMVKTVEVNFTYKVVTALLYLSFVGAGIAQFTWVKCLSMLPASTCSLFYPLQPIFASLLGALILGEPFTIPFFIGLALISADIVISAKENTN